jgi:hypothetical protein
MLSNKRFNFSLLNIPILNKPTNEVQPDSIRFNFKTQKALIWNSRSDQGEFKIKRQLPKKKTIPFIS